MLEFITILSSPFVVRVLFKNGAISFSHHDNDNEAFIAEYSRTKCFCNGKIRWSTFCNSHTRRHDLLARVIDFFAFYLDNMSNCWNGVLFILSSDLGTGKSCFARGYIRGFLQDKNTVVMSPTYILDQLYERGNTRFVRILSSFPSTSKCYLHSMQASSYGLL